MKSIIRQPAAFVAGFAAILLLSFTAVAQTLPAATAKQEGLVLSLTERLRIVRPGCCFCSDNASDDVLHRRLINNRPLKTEPRVPNFEDRLPYFLLMNGRPLKTRPSVTDVMAPLVPAPSSLPNTETDIRVIDLEGLKKVLQREPNDKRPLLLNFWATWCDPCREEFPDLVKLDADYKDKPLNFIAISLDDITDLNSEVPKFLTQMKATMPVVLLNVKDPEPAIKVVDANWDGQLPATFLYDKDGKVVFKHFGKIKPDELRAAIDKEIKK